MLSTFRSTRSANTKSRNTGADNCARRGSPSTVLVHLQRNITAQGQDTVRAKKAVACLYYVSGMGMEEIERAMSQFGGAFDGSAGPIRAITGRTCDVLPMIGRVAELLHSGLDLGQRGSRLLLRLDLGIQGPVVDLARYAERNLDRADYRRLCEAQNDGARSASGS